MLAHCALQWNSTFRLDSFRSQLHSAFLYVLNTSLLYTRCLRRAVNVTCIKSKVGLLQTAHSWANAEVLFGARVGWRVVAFETIKLIHAPPIAIKRIEIVPLFTKHILKDEFCWQFDILKHNSD